MQFPAENNAGQRIVQQFFKNFPLPFLIQTVHIGIFHKSDNLQTRRLKMLKISCQLQRRSVDIRLRHLNLRDIDFRRQILPLELFNHLC